jgi:hypothetical protein
MGDHLEGQGFGNDVSPSVTQQVEQVSLGKIIGGALAASLVGAIVWALIAYYGNFELGILAMGVGALVGITVAYLAKRSVVQSHQVISVIFGLAGVIAGKYFTYYLIVKEIEADMGVSIKELGLVTFSDMFEAIDILWIVLAAAAAWTIPKKYSS